MFCLSDFEAHAQKVLDRNAWDYYSSGANHEQTLRDNKEAFQRCVVSCVGHKCTASSMLSLLPRAAGIDSVLVS